MAFWNNPSDLTPKRSYRWVISFGRHDDKEGVSRIELNTLPFYFAKSVDLPSYEIGVQQAKYLYSHTFNFPKRLTWKPIRLSLNDVIVETANASLLFKPTVETYNNLNKLTTSQSLIKNGTRTLTTSNVVKQSTQVFFYRFLQDSGYFDPEEYDKKDQLLRFRKYNFKKDMIRSLVGTEQDYETDIFEDGFKLNSTINTAEWNTLNIQQLDESGNAIETWKLYAPLISDVTFDKQDYGSENILNITATIYYDWAKLVPASVTSKKINLPEPLGQFETPVYQRDFSVGIASKVETTLGAIGTATTTQNVNPIIENKPPDLEKQNFNLNLNKEQYQRTTVPLSKNTT